MHFDKVNTLIDKRFAKISDNVNDKDDLLCGDGEDSRLLRRLYAFMPASDCLTYDASLFMQFVRHAIWLREIYDWCKCLPDEIFLNYVLHYRVNNENIEFCRGVFYGELAGIISGLSMTDAALAVNYWCLEKVTYRATNSRTVSPLTSVKAAFGRCGEESVFTVSALRSVGIPARQCYTPRWAHCDDNHAWVEAYIDGAWRYLGACEPEEALDRGWFSYSATKAMLVHARQFTPFVLSGEEILYTGNCDTEINVTSRYAETVSLTIIVANAPENTTVSFEICNYSELFSLVTLPLKDNAVTVSLGKGTIHLNITDGSLYLSVLLDLSNSDSEFVKVFDFKNAVVFEIEPKVFIFSPPCGTPVIPVPYSEEKNKKIKAANLVRSSFETSFINEATGLLFAKTLSSDEDICHEIASYLTLARANHQEIASFLRSGLNLKLRLALLSSIEAKDLTDITAEVLTEHLDYSQEYENLFELDIFVKYILCPRIADEQLYRFRVFILSYFSADERAFFKESPHEIYRFTAANIEDASIMDYPPLLCCHTGVMIHKKCSKSNTHLLFVAICRTLGIPARLNTRNLLPEYYQGGCWLDAQTGTKPELVKVNLKSPARLKFLENYTIAKLESGTYKTLSLPHGFSGDTLKLEAGRYRMLTCGRSPAGDVSVSCFFFEAAGTEGLDISVEMPAVYKTDSLIDIRGIDINGRHLTEIVNKSELCCFIKPGTEPTEHLFNELLDSYDNLISIKLILEDDTVSLSHPSLKRLLSEFSNIELIVSNDLAFEDAMFRSIRTTENGYPVIFAINSKKEVCYFSSGYNAGSVKLALSAVL